VTSARPGPAARFAGFAERCDVVVVGGGVLGLASAYELARRNLSVVLVESGWVGGRQSGRNLGFVRQQGRALAELPMMMAANQRWRGLGNELGSDVEWQMGGQPPAHKRPGAGEPFTNGGRLMPSPSDSAAGS
jgi:glycine/D-amino acid oxidase-like deaminating enzyme